MNKIKTILICLIIILATCAICTGLIMMNEKTTTVKLSETCSISITGEYDTVFENGMNQIKIFDKFNNKEYKSIVVYSGANAGMQEIVSFGMFKSFFVGNAWDTGAEPVKTEWNGDTVYAIYTGNNATHDNILIISKNRDDCIKMYNSIKYNTNNVTKNMNHTNITNTTVEEISNTNNNQQNNNNEKKDITDKPARDLSKNTVDDDIAIMKQSRDNGGHYSGLSDKQIEERAYSYHSTR